MTGVTAAASPIIHQQFQENIMKQSMLHTGAALLMLAATVGFTACNSDNGPVMPEQTAQQNTTGNTSFLKVGRGMIWAGCTLFNTVGTPANFNPGNGPFDELYTIPGSVGSFKNGIGAISESMPGDMDFNGGRWHVNVLKDGVDASQYANACSVGDLDTGDFMSTDTYFECPLIPMNRRP
jgi:hypothetical protein